jgi:orotate phosphoribosyltransferase
MPETRAKIRAEIATTLLEIGAFLFSAHEMFTWASGIQSPVYCDNRLVLGEPEARKVVTRGFVRLYRSLDPQPEVLVGTATAGIPHAAWLASELDLPMGYVRSSAKAHGRARVVEGIRPDGQTALVIEDLVSTGGSSIAAVTALRSEGLVANTVAAIFSYGLPMAHQAFAAADCALETLATLDDLLPVAVAGGHLSAENAERVESWRRDVRLAGV